jgi:osmotically-inducible protein OsmY
LAVPLALARRDMGMWRKLAVTVSLMTLAACATRAASPPGSPGGEAPADEATAAEVYKALNADPVYFFKHVDVQVSHGVATLSGYVWSTPAIYRAKKVAAGVPGVTSVVNQMELEREGIYRRR